MQELVANLSTCVNSFCALPLKPLLAAEFWAGSGRVC